MLTADTYFKRPIRFLSPPRTHNDQLANTFLVKYLEWVIREKLLLNVGVQKLAFCVIPARVDKPADPADSRSCGSP